MSAIETNYLNIQELVELLEDVKGALRLFIRISRGVKWVAGLIITCSGVSWVVRHFGGAP